jgi:predicted metal-dependent HD superfamily phosphohydrolase
MELDRQSMEVLQIAGWFHDTGYAEPGEGHEERSARIARAFLANEGYPAELTERVIRCIGATRLPQEPTNLEQQVLCDADVHHAGTGEFFPRGDLLREEVELRDGIRYDDAGWLEVNLEFLYQHPFHTPYARQQFGPGREANIAEVKRRLEAARSVARR